MNSVSQLIEFAQSELAALADLAKGGPMQAYMKTGMPFYGVPTPLRRPIVREVRKRFVPDTAAEYRTNVLGLWNLPHREEKYLAVGYAWDFKKFVTIDQIPLYQQMIVEGAWWDFVDELASPIVGHVVLNDRERMRPILEAWIRDDDMWLRRTAIICQNRHKHQTDQSMLFDFCLCRAHEKEFFIRKAIGWALREYAKTDPAAVREFLSRDGEKLSGLSYREASKHL